MKAIISKIEKADDGCVLNVLNRGTFSTKVYLTESNMIEIAKMLDKRKKTTSLCDSILGFLVELDNIDGKISSEVYLAYRHYCREKEAKHLTHIEFSRQINRALNSKSVVRRFGKTVRRVFKEGGV